MRRVSEKIIPRALTIAGSDSGGGAGIQADLKTFAALGVHGTSAITALTAQNTLGVTETFAIPSKMVISQIEAVRSDIGFDAVKTGMLANEEIVTAVSEYLAKQRRREKLVVDPVMVAKSGAPLLRRNAVDALIQKLLPLSYVATPNAEEAKVLLDLKKSISSLDQAAAAAKRISKYGPKIVIVKGGHLPKSKKKRAIDIVYYKDRDKIQYLESEWFDTKNTHGTGCVFSAAIAAELAKSVDVEKAVWGAKSFVADAIKWGLGVGRGHGPVNPTGSLLREGEKIQLLQELSKAVEYLTSIRAFGNLIPESRSNFVAAGEYSETTGDVAAVPGRITTVFGKPLAVGGIGFGGSDHVARFLLGARRFDHSIKSAINLRYSKELLTVLRGMGLTLASYSREDEPKEIRSREGRTMDWAIAHVARKTGWKLPDAVVDLGGKGKEPMIKLLGKNPEQLARRVAKIAIRLQNTRLFSRV